MKIINSKTHRFMDDGIMHRITVEFADGRKTTMIVSRDCHWERLVSLGAACQIAGVSEDKYRAFLKSRGFETEYVMVPAEINGTLQALKMVFTNPLYVAEFIKLRKGYGDICAWFNTIGRSNLDTVIDFGGVMNPVEAKRAGILSIPVDAPSPVARRAAPAAPVSIDFDATGGIEQLNRIISSLDVPYQVRARALSIQNDFSQLANVIDTLNTTGKAA